MSLSRDAILAAAKPRIEKVPVPEWGGELFVREMTALDRDRFDSQLAENMDLRRAKAFLLCACDENGKALFSDHDIQAVMAMPSGPIDRCCDVIWRLSSMFGRGEDVQKNSEGQGAD